MSGSRRRHDRRRRADRPRARLLPRRRRSSQLRKITAGLDEVIANVGEILEKTAPVNDVVHRDQRAPRRRRRPARGPAGEEGRPRGRRGPGRRPVPGRGRRRAAELPRERGDHAAADRRGLHQGHAHARAARPRGADRRGQPGRRRCCATSRAAAWPRGCSTRTSARRGPETLPRSPVIGTDAPVQYEQRDDIGAPRKRLPDPRSLSMQTPAPFEYERATSVEGAIAALAAARPRGADHRRRPQPAADDEAAAGEPRAPDRHQRPHRALLHPRGGATRSGSAR